MNPDGTDKQQNTERPQAKAEPTERLVAEAISGRSSDGDGDGRGTVQNRVLSVGGQTSDASGAFSSKQEHKQEQEVQGKTRQERQDSQSPNNAASPPSLRKTAPMPATSSPTKPAQPKPAVQKPAVTAAAKKYVASSLKPAEKWNSVYTLDDARKGAWQKPTQIIGNLLLAQSALLVSAHPHSMKSLAFLQAALEACARKTVWGHIPTPTVTKALFIETEDPPWLVQDRIRGLAKGLGIKDAEQVPGFRWICPGPFALVEEMREIAKLLDKHKPDFAVISTLQNIIPGRDMNEQKDMAPVNRAIITLARQCCPIVMITHSTWDKKNKRALGSITQAANYATTMHFEKSSGDQVKVTLNSKIGSEEEEFLLHLETEEGSHRDSDGTEQNKREVRRLVYQPKKSPKKAKVVAAMKDLGDSASSEKIAAKAGVTGRYVRKVRAAKNETTAKNKNGPFTKANQGGSATPGNESIGGMKEMKEGMRSTKTRNPALGGPKSVPPTVPRAP